MQCGSRVTSRRRRVPLWMMCSALLIFKPLRHFAVCCVLVLNLLPMVLPGLYLCTSLQMGLAETPDSNTVSSTDSLKSIYPLGAGDELTIYVSGAEELDELNKTSFSIDNDGNLNVPLIGRVHAAGLTAMQLQTALTERLKTYVKDPQLYVNLKTLKSQPMSVLGAVNTPGVHQLDGSRTLVDALAIAGGLSKDAGYKINITRQLKWGPIPLPGAVIDPAGRYSSAEVNARELTDGKNPDLNIAIRPNDVIMVPKSQLVYVIGEVKKAGGFTLGEQKSVSVLQALSFAEGLSATASAGRAKIIRNTPDQSKRIEIAVNLRKILKGQAPDVTLDANDILFVPDNSEKKAGIKIAETALQTISGVVIWHGL